MTVESPQPWCRPGIAIYGASRREPEQLARALGVSRRRINLLVHGQRSVTAETALMLSRYFGTSPELWTDIHGRYDLAIAKRRMRDRFEQIPAPTSR